MKEYSVICFWPKDIYKNHSFSIPVVDTFNIHPWSIRNHTKELEKSAKREYVDDITLRIDTVKGDVKVTVPSVYLPHNDDVDIRKSAKVTSVTSYKICYFAEYNAILGNLIMEQLKESLLFRHNFFHYVTFHWQQIKCTHIQETANLETTSNTSPNLVIMALQWPSMYILDYKWNYRVHKLVIRALHLADAMNWLNTLGGGYSALGDYSRQHAEHAGQISCRQLCIAVEMGDPSTVIRCHLYYALSLMQTGRLRESKYTIRRCYKKALSLTIPDLQVIAMCKGMWSRLRYKYIQRKNRINFM